MKTSFQLYHQGVEKYKSGNYKEAITDFTGEINTNASMCPEPYIYRGLARYFTGEKNGALEDWLKAAELGDTNVYDLIDRYFN